MGLQEFNEKYKDYLEEGHYGLAIPDPDIVNYLDKEFQELIKIPGFSYSQIKIKFDYVRFYCENVPLIERDRIQSNIQEIYDKTRK